jgi:CheY-like chemotaxis protein
MDAIRKVLVVDDDPVVGKSFDRVLKGKGYAVITERSGAEALKKLRAEKYDVVFTDIKMPGMSGLEVAERVKASQPWLPVVVVTGYGTDANEARARAAGVSGFLRKPLSPEMIEGSAREALLERTAAVALSEADLAAEVPALLALTLDSALQPAVTFVKNVALFFAAPFIGLAYVIAFPFIGLGMLAWMGGCELMKYGVVRKIAGIVKNVGLFVVAPFIGLAFVIAFPFIGLAMLTWMGARALIQVSGRQLRKASRAGGRW